MRQTRLVRRAATRAGAAPLALLLCANVFAAQPQDPANPAGSTDSSGMTTAPWSIGVDGALFGTFNRQGGLRGETEFRSQNWLMAMASRPLKGGTFTLTGMFTAEPFTARPPGYSQILQEGETYHGRQITDHQHPHDLFMQLSAAWQVPIGNGFSLTMAGGPVGEPALGPVAFMHRASSAENPSAPLSHHIFDSTHLASDVLLLRLDRGIVSLEGSIFRGREPDENRYDLDLGRPDSWSMRMWLRPRPAWTIQASHGFLHEPEALEPGDQWRTNGSVSWFQQRRANFTAFTAAIGRNKRPYSAVRSVLAEGTHRFGRTLVYGRFERTSVETEILLFPLLLHRPHPGELVDPIRAMTAGTIVDFAKARSLAVGIGADVTIYGVPDLLAITYGSRPVSFHVFLRLARAAPENRMWNLTMAGHGVMAHDMAQTP